MASSPPHAHEPGAALGVARLLAPLFLAALALVACRAGSDAPAADTDTDTAATARLVPIGDLEWYVDYDEAVLVARRRDVPLWVHFGENPG